MMWVQALGLALTLLLLGPAIAGQQERDPRSTASSLPDPCEVAPMLPFCRP